MAALAPRDKGAATLAPNAAIASHVLAGLRAINIDHMRIKIFMTCPVPSAFAPESR
jgi:hypothetical protein